MPLSIKKVLMISLLLTYRPLYFDDYGSILCEVSSSISILNREGEILTQK